MKSITNIEVSLFLNFHCYGNPNRAKRGSGSIKNISDQDLYLVWLSTGNLFAPSHLSNLNT